MAMKHHRFLIGHTGDTSSNGWFSIVTLVFGGVDTKDDRLEDVSPASNMASFGG